jgi:light-regulated signal transduction histidine kinase (bacteriophytochrome)
MSADNPEQRMGDKKRDMTDALEVCRQENRQLVYVISHDLREPLRMVKSYMDLFAGRYGGQLDEAADEFIGYALDGARRAEWMLDGLLEYSRVAHCEPGVERVALNDIVGQAVERLRAAYPDTSFEFESASLPVLSTDRHLLRRLWGHVLDNAVKFRDTDRPLKISVDVDQGDGEWRFLIADNGIGFEPRFAERIFDLFHSLHPVGRYPGVGMGLAISRRIAGSLGGALRAKGVAGQGAVFELSLPAVD